MIGDRGAPGQRQPSAKPPFGEGPRKPLKKKAVKKRFDGATVVQDLMLRDGRCYFADHYADGCDGRTDPAHIVPQRVIKQAFPLGAVLDGEWRPVEPHETYTRGLYCSLEKMLADPRNLLGLCRKHHQRYDAGKPNTFLLRAEFHEFAADYGFEFQGRYWVRP